MPKDKRPAKGVSQKVPSTSSTALLLIGTFIDTTWRLFVPTISGVVIGLLADSYFETKPWLTICGVVLGFLTAMSLVYMQIRVIKK